MKTSTILFYYCGIINLYKHTHTHMCEHTHAHRYTLLTSRVCSINEIENEPTKVISFHKTSTNHDFSWWIRWKLKTTTSILKTKDNI